MRTRLRARIGRPAVLNLARKKLPDPRVARRMSDQNDCGKKKKNLRRKKHPHSSFRRSAAGRCPASELFVRSPKIAKKREKKRKKISSPQTNGKKRDSGALQL